MCVCGCLDLSRSVLSSALSLYYFHLEGVGRGLSALPAKLTTPTLHIGRHSYHLTSWWKYFLTHKPSSEIRKAFYLNKKEDLSFHWIINWGCSKFRSSKETDKKFSSKPITYFLTDQLIDMMSYLSLQLVSVCLG